MMNPVLVTGGTGFVGSNLAAALLAEGYKVRILRRANSDLRTIAGLPVDEVVGDILQPESLHDAVKGCDTVFHTAALVSHSKHLREQVQHINVDGTRNVVEACLKHGVKKLVHVSSIAAIGHAPRGELADERTPFTWGALPGYKLSKHIAEQEVATGVDRGLNAVIVNPSVIVGERDINFHGGQLIRSAKRGHLLFYISGGMNIVYVGDVARGIIQAASKGRTGERYLLCGENLTHKEIFTRTAHLVGGRAPLARLPIPLLHAGVQAVEMACNLLHVEPWITDDLIANAGVENWYNCEKAKQELGYTITPFDEAIVAAFRWYQEQGLL